jgi:acyl-CoA synthetase (NDP forming)
MNKLDKLFNPKTIAIIGASEEANTVGRGLTKNIIENNASKKVFMVNPNEAKVFGIDCIDRIQHIKEKIDLAVVIVPGKVVLNIVGQCCEKKVGSMIIISNGFGEEGEEGKKKEEEIKKMVKAAGISFGRTQLSRNYECGPRAQRFFRSGYSEEGQYRFPVPVGSPP